MHDQFIWDEVKISDGLGAFFDVFYWGEKSWKSGTKKRQDTPKSILPSLF